MRVLFVDIDTTRADHLSCYGYPRKTTPNFDSVAEDGVRFENYYCSDAPCLPSRSALVSGKFGIVSGVVGHGGTCGDRRLEGEPRSFRCSYDQNNLHNRFRDAGMHAVSFSTFAERHSAYWFDAGFNEIHNVGKGGSEKAEEVMPLALEWVKNNGAKDNWYLHINLWDPHTPYRTPEDYDPFKDEPLHTWVTEEIFEKQLKAIGPHGLMEIGMYNDNENPLYPKHPGKVTEYQKLRQLIDGYDSGIHYADMMYGKVFSELKRLGVYDDTAIIITSDHGENMGELGIYSEHATADRPTCHIPMIIKWPGGAKNAVDKGLHYNLDLLPTVAELLGQPKQPSWNGDSYAGTVLHGEDCGRDSLVISQMAHVCQRSAVFGDWLYMRTYHDGYHLWDKEMLFNTKEDPYEQHDVKDEYPEVCAKGAKIILDWHDEQMAASGNIDDPMWTVLKEGGPLHAKGHLPEYLKRLDKTGRSEGAQKLREKYQV
ncbi:MAG TPA: sulfatase-like hydrolase/transferase [Oscillospiraceae bacterium]|nr:sulfatase-like hydrolase/transferase [Oscillospiraceae bacterium]HPF55878.1 sulfatase-like hydrolase/transferase [Clostridiales bacterium]HPK35175.1 sulfatase-like hydrolase/transferase [Oscillospiraceae bacterium]HPR74978.1 sulfatase-like hydrolase/transferase [Oscillospiraceae bacterium]